MADQDIMNEQKFKNKFHYSKGDICPHARVETRNPEWFRCLAMEAMGIIPTAPPIPVVPGTCICDFRVINKQELEDFKTGKISLAEMETRMAARNYQLS
ncbi:MAG: hypothetical protein LBQ49_02095 [Rickettsiales bacterium]|jgi:hypothetical protein|nr:hypothetical protein [Rickettsiales bacterium]